jgi:hypothetical protein
MLISPFLLLCGTELVGIGEGVPADPGLAFALGWVDLPSSALGKYGSSVVGETVLGVEAGRGHAAYAIAPTTISSTTKGITVFNPTFFGLGMHTLSRVSIPS